MLDKLTPNNVHNIERGARVVLGLGMLSALALVPQTSLAFLGLIGLVPLVTGIVGTCPIYTVLGMSTCPVPAVE